MHLGAAILLGWGKGVGDGVEEGKRGKRKDGVKVWDKVLRKKER